MELPTYHVLHEDDQWVVWKQDSAHTRPARDRDDAIEDAYSLARAKAPARVFLHRRDGSVADHTLVQRPLWARPAFAWGAGALAVACGVVGGLAWYDATHGRRWLPDLARRS